MTKFDVLFVEQYRSGHRYRRRVPADVRDKIGKSSWCHNFPSRTPLAVIEREAKRLAILHDREITIARGQEVGPDQIEHAEGFARELIAGDRRDLYGYLELATQEDMSPQTAAIVNALEHGGRYLPESLPLTAALERDKRLYGGERDKKPVQYAVSAFVDSLGDKGVTAISRGDVSEWLAVQTKGGLAPATIKRRLGALRALINRAFLDLDHSGRNPFERHKIKDSNGGASDRLPFNKAMIDLIDTHLSSNKRLGHETRNILRIMRNTGGGPAEIGGLVLADVSLGGAIPYLWIRQNALRRIKTAVRDRQVPLVGDALEAARDAHKRAMVRAKGSRKNADKTPLFTSFGINNRGADAISAKLNNCIRAAGVPKSSRLVSYSFRHNVKEALRLAGVLNHVQDRIMGHSGEGQISARYGSPRARLSEAKDALERALDHRGDVDDSIFSERERMK